jgi:hypothetical protein
VESATQTLDELFNTLSRLDIEWQDDMSRQVIAKLELFPRKPRYELDDVAEVLDADFDAGTLLLRLFLGLSKDLFEAELRGLLGGAGIGIKRFQTDRENFLSALQKLDLLQAMATTVNREPMWSDVLVERLRSGRGSAVSGQKRGRHVEDFVEKIVEDVFAADYEARCTFMGQRENTAKCDFAIPSRGAPRVIIEAKGYGATGSKMTDVIGDIEKIIAAKRADTMFLFFTDGTSWLQRKSDFKKIIEYQNQGDIFRIYTLKMAEQFRADLEAIKREKCL